VDPNKPHPHSTEKWVTITRKVPEEVAKVIMLAETCAVEILKLTDMLATSIPARRVDVTELIYSEFLLTNRRSYLDAWKALSDEDSYIWTQKLAALERDDWRCRMCGHTRANKGPGALNAHHVIPKSYHGPERPTDIDNVSNLATLCAECHARVHATGWRNYLTELSNG